LPLDAGLVDHGYTASELWGLGYLAETKGPTRYLVIHPDRPGSLRRDPRTSHLGILNTPEAWQAALEFLSER
jgi:hypothetical protein